MRDKHLKVAFGQVLGQKSMSLGRSIAWVTAGNALGQILQLLMLPLLSSLAPPAAFGAYTIFLGAGGIASIFAGLRYDSAIVLPRGEEKARALVLIVVVLAFGTAVVFLLLTYVAALAVRGSELAGVLQPMGLALCCSILLSAMLRVSNAWLSREFRFALMGVTQFLAATTTVGLQLLMLSSGVETVSALIWGSVFGQAAAVLLAGIPMLPVFSKLVISGPSWALVAEAAREYKAFPKYMIAYGLNSTLRERLIHFILGGFAGADVLGRFAMAQRLVSAPHSLLYSGISPVLYAHASRADRPIVGASGARLIELASVMLVAPYVFFASGAETIVQHGFGQKWDGTQDYIRILAIPFLILSCTGFLDRLFDAYRNQRVSLQLELGGSVIILSIVFVLAATGFSHAAVVGFAVLFGAYELVWTFVVYRANDLPLDLLRRPAILACAYFVAASIAVLLLAGIRETHLQAALAITTYAVMIILYLRFLSGWVEIRRLFST